MRLPQWSGYGFALGAMLLIGCSSNMVGPGPERANTAGQLSLFDNPHGYGALEMRVVDQRRGYGVQAIDAADPFEEVQIRLGGSKITPRFATMSARVDNQYQSDKLGMLPPGNDYNLTVSLATKSVMLGGPILVGQGAAEQIDVMPGSTRSVIVLINAVGEITLVSDGYTVAHSSPEIATGSPGFGFPEVLSTTRVKAHVDFPDDSDMPQSQRIDRVHMQLTDDAGNVLLASASIPIYLDENDQPYGEFFVPDFQGVEKLGWLTVFGMHVTETLSETLISSKTRGILMLKGATLSVNLE